MKAEVKHVWAGDAAEAFVRHVDDTVARHAEYQTAAQQVADALGEVNKAMTTCAHDSVAAVDDAAAAILSGGLLGGTGFLGGLHSGATDLATLNTAKVASGWTKIAFGAAMAGLPLTAIGAIVTILTTLSGKLAEIQAIVDRDAGAALAQLRAASGRLAQLKLPGEMAESLREPTHWLPKPFGSTVVQVPPGFGEHLAQVSAEHFGKDVSSSALRAFEQESDRAKDGLDDGDYLAAAQAIGGYADDVDLGSPVAAPAETVRYETVPVVPPPLEMPPAPPVTLPPVGAQ